MNRKSFFLVWPLLIAGSLLTLSPGFAQLTLPPKTPAAAPSSPIDEKALEQEPPEQESDLLDNEDPELAEPESLPKTLPETEDDTKLGDGELSDTEPELDPQPATEPPKVVIPSLPSDDPLPVIRRDRKPIEVQVKPSARRIKHPNAEKGLTKITRDKVYIYKVPRSEQKNAFSARIGFMSPDNLENPDTGAKFVDFYDSSSNPALLVDYEWHLAKRFGKMGVKAGSGVAFAQGNGQFSNASAQGGLLPKENLSFVVLPNSLGAVWRLEFWERQWLVPYAEGGGVLFAFTELRDDDKSPKFGGALGAYFALGGALNLHRFDRITLLELDREYGINDIYLTAEYRYYQGFGNFDFTTDVISGGFLFEF